MFRFVGLFVALMLMLALCSPADAQCNVQRSSASASSAVDLQNQALAVQLAELQRQIQQQRSSASTAAVTARAVRPQRLFVVQAPQSAPSTAASSVAGGASASASSSAVPQPDVAAILAVLQAQQTSAVQLASCADGSCSNSRALLQGRVRGMRPRLLGSRSVSRSVSISRQ